MGVSGEPGRDRVGLIVTGLPQRWKEEGKGDPGDSGTMPCSYLWRRPEKELLQGQKCCTCAAQPGTKTQIRSGAGK